jgi:hypothetical protein
MLFSVFGANLAFAMTMTTSDVTYFQTETIHVTKADNVGFAARAPPMAVSNVEVTGDVIVIRGSAFALHGQKTVAALFGFDADHTAPNTGRPLTQIDNFVDLTNGRSGHILANHRAGAGKLGKTEFPANWDDQRIVHQVSDIANDPNLTRQVDSRGTPSVTGTRDGIDITVTFFPDNHARAGKISSAYPTNLPAYPRP